ncbi:MAG: hypothetical protein ACPGN3_16885 [Opitutales bacterium]
MNYSTHSPKGSTILVVIIITTGIALVLGSLFTYTVTEKRLNASSEAHLTAKQASEAAAEFGFAQLKERFDHQSSFSTNELSPSLKPLELPSTYDNLYSKGSSGPGSSMTLSVGNGTWQDWGIPSVEIPQGGFDPTAQWGSQNLELIAGVIETTGWTYVDPDTPGNENDPLAGSQVFERFVQIYSKATVTGALGQDVSSYTTQTLELRDAPLFAYAIFYNGLPMEIAPGPQMDIYGPVHSNSDIYIKGNRRLNFHDRITTAGDIYHGRNPSHKDDTSTKNTYIANGADVLVEMEDGVNSTADDWRETASQLWDGRVMTREHSISEQNPVGVQEYVADTDDSTDAWDPLNYAYNLIQPVLDSDELTLPDPATDADAYEQAVIRSELEKEKYSYKAGLVLEYDGSAVNVFTYTRDADGNLTYNGDGTPAKTELTIDSSNHFWDINTEGDFTDAREGRSPDLIEINVAALKDLLDTNDETEWGAATADSSAAEKPENFWNGIIYIQTPLASMATSRADWVTPADNTVAVRLSKGSVIPNPSYAAANGNYGTTFATNTYLYVQGHFNADGDPDTGSATEPDNTDTFADPGEEAPAALVADAINVLSNSWDDDDSDDDDLEDREASFTEISAAFLSGQVPCGFNGTKSYSGGVENFPRFLEDWSDVEFQLRGSLVALYNSEVAVERWGKSDVYSPPDRDWGFHAKFGSEGYYPPGTPNTRTYRRARFTDLSAEQYALEVKELADLWGLTTAY